MLGVYQPCIPIRSTTVPSGLHWLHEIKHDGYRLMVRRTGDRVQLLTRNGFDWVERYPCIALAARKLKVRSVVIDGEAVVCREDGVSDFQKLHSRAYDDQAILYAFDLLELDGEDLRPWPLEQRKAMLATLLRWVPSGIYLVEHEIGDGAALFAAACRLGLEGIVSKRRDMHYTAGLSKAWIKVKNPNSPAMLRLDDLEWTWTKRTSRER
jgi:bifunctional non-homologous end joining protein LigD